MWFEGLWYALGVPLVGGYASSSQLDSTRRVPVGWSSAE